MPKKKHRYPYLSAIDANWKARAIQLAEDSKQFFIYDLTNQDITFLMTEIVNQADGYPSDSVKVCGECRMAAFGFSPEEPFCAHWSASQVQPS